MTQPLGHQMQVRILPAQHLRSEQAYIKVLEATLRGDVEDALSTI
jgi:hypothetical protein